MNRNLLYTVRGDRLCLQVKVMPGAGRRGIVGVKNQELVIRLKAQAEKGRANKELAGFLSKALALRKAEVEILAGESAPHKLIGLPAAALDRLVEILAP